MNFTPLLDREFLLAGYRRLMQSLYEPRNFYARIRTFLGRYQSHSHVSSLSASDIRAFVKSIWLLGVRHRGRRGYWRLFLETLLRKPRLFSRAMELSIMGYHFRKIARDL